MTTTKLPVAWVVNIGYHDADDASHPSVCARIFAEMLSLALPTVKHYQSDLYHDALWLAKGMPTNEPWWFGIRESGTSIGTDHRLVSAYNAKTYRMVVHRNERDAWVLTASVETEESYRLMGLKEDN